ncbi:MAG: alpha/beta hydrolase, partial [Spirochaetes bacterium]|nr:alpha/beta hydrolase [Spirochaetota bacterium]
GDDIIQTGITELAELINQLNLKPVHLLGHCLGGAIALLYTVAYPHTVKKVIASAAGYYSDHKSLVKTDWTFQPFNKINHQLRKQLIEMHGPEYALKFWDILCNYKETYIMNSDYDIRKEVKKIKCPFFIINGDRDFYFEVEHPLSVYQKMKNNSILWIVPDTGHDIHIEKEDDFIKMVEYFIETKF